MHSPTCAIEYQTSYAAETSDGDMERKGRTPSECQMRLKIYQRVVVNFIVFILCKQIEIDLGKQSRYHSVFACPILRQQSTENNPPMKLVCGHVISRDALNKLTSANK